MPVKKRSKSSVRVTAFCSSQALKKNFRALAKRAGRLSLLPMVKAGAYGHGIEWVVKTLHKEPSFFRKINGFGVATFSEAESVREVLGSQALERVVLFSGAMPWTRENQNRCVRSNITPVIGSLQDLEIFLRLKGDLCVPSYELKFNTGMNRLGIRCEAWSQVEALFHKAKKLRAVNDPQGVFSHLAAAEVPSHAVSRLQLKLFKNIIPIWKHAFPHAKLHLGNSAALWNSKAFELREHTDLVRPGLALYGIRPFPEAQASDIKQVMEVYAPIAQIAEVRAGECVGYGAHFQVPRHSRVRKIAILAAGYGDGVPRSLESHGHVRMGNQLATFAGRISMDLSTVLIPEFMSRSVKLPSWVEIFGRKVDIWKQAEAAQTIPYELLTSLSARVERKYDDRNPG